MIEINKYRKKMHFSILFSGRCQRPITESGLHCGPVGPVVVQTGDQQWVRSEIYSS